MDINLPVTDGAAFLKYGAEGMNQACITDIHTRYEYAGYVSEYTSTSLFPQDSDHGAGWLWHLGVNPP